MSLLGLNACTVGTGSPISEHIGIDFALSHALHMKAIHGGKAKNDHIDSFKIVKLIRITLFLVNL